MLTVLTVLPPHLPSSTYRMAEPDSLSCDLTEAVRLDVAGWLLMARGRHAEVARTGPAGAADFRKKNYR